MRPPYGPASSAKKGWGRSAYSAALESSTSAATVHGHDPAKHPFGEESIGWPALLRLGARSGGEPRSREAWTAFYREAGVGVVEAITLTLYSRTQIYSLTFRRLLPKNILRMEICWTYHSHLACILHPLLHDHRHSVLLKASI